MRELLIVVLTVPLAAQGPTTPPPLAPIPAPSTRLRPTQHKNRDRTAHKRPVTITAGRRDEKAMRIRNAPQQIRLRVASLTHISEGCVARR